MKHLMNVLGSVKPSKYLPTDWACSSFFSQKPCLHAKLTWGQNDVEQTQVELYLAEYMSTEGRS